MGSGKSTLAPKLARKLGTQAYDLDSIIEAETQQSIASLFATIGEEKFRAIEGETLRKFIADNENFVLATGGGTPCFGDLMNLMNSTGITIYLELPAKALVERIKPGKHKRPLLANLTDEELMDYITAKLEERNPFYKKSMISVDGLSVKANHLAEIIVNHSR